jgi:hypothetical protein
MAVFLEDGTVNVLVEGGVRVNIPFLLDIFEVFPNLLPTRVALCEGEVFVEILVVQLIDRRVAVYACSWVAIPGCGGGSSELRSRKIVWLSCR